MDDEISQGPERGSGMSPKRRLWLTAVAIAGVGAAGALFAVGHGGGPHAERSHPLLSATATPSRQLVIAAAAEPAPVADTPTLPALAPVPPTWASASHPVTRRPSRSGSRRRPDLSG